MKTRRPDSYIPGLPDRQLATLLGISHSLLSLWRKGLRSLSAPALETILLLQRLLNPSEPAPQPGQLVHPASQERLIRWQERQRSLQALNLALADRLEKKLHAMRIRHAEKLRLLRVMLDMRFQRIYLPHDDPRRLGWELTYSTLFETLPHTDELAQAKLEAKIRRLR